jgi:hypothetical protein
MMKQRILGFAFILATTATASGAKDHTPPNSTEARGRGEGSATGAASGSRYIFNHAAPPNLGDGIEPRPFSRDSPRASKARS